MDSKFILIFLLINLSICFARVPPRNHETEETASDNTKDPIEVPVERSPIDSSNNEGKLSTDSNKQAGPVKPIGIILFKQYPFTNFLNRSPHHIFSPAFSSPFFNHHSHFDDNLHDDPSLRLFSLLFGNRRLKPMQPDSSETEAVNASSESAESTELGNRGDIHPIESLFPNIFTIPKFPLDEIEKEGEASTSNEDKTLDNFENKEKKVVTIGNRKFVKTTKTKKVKNDFGQFHSVVSSYEPFDEKIHDQNGNEKIKPEETEEKVSSSSNSDKKKVETPKVTNEKNDLPKSSEDKTSKKDDNTTPSTTTSTSTFSLAIEKEESSNAVTPKVLPEKKLIAENLSKDNDESKNEIPMDKNAEIKVDQMS